MFFNVFQCKKVKFTYFFVLLFLLSFGMEAVEITKLSNGITDDNSIKKGESKYYYFNTLNFSQGRTGVVIELSGLSDDLDLYVKEGAYPTAKNYDCRPYKGGKTSERCYLEFDNNSIIFVEVNGFGSSNYKLKTLLRSTSNELRFPSTGTNWEVTLGSIFHKSSGGIGGMDDTFALDFNLPNDADDGLSVYPIESGEVVYVNSSYGFVLVRHRTNLKLGSNTSINNWYSGYMHMSGILPKAGDWVYSTTKIGEISNTKTGVNHLHFATYIGDHNNLSTLVSFDIGNRLSDLWINNVSKWHEWCGKNYLYSTVIPWWDQAKPPCP